ncbi:hypothetical protein C0W80_16030 [Photobacterium leiognathi subsp. mandapamensis]|uniref:RloB family protein n=1 Tax=Photobacterium leiognathi TaxID=553611 RepID=UPI000D15DE0A|nr:RloB family protein [Photobacterium leiognathi]PSU97833.1 hypothetical protein C0W80_16030 [Photobacterium leiognathi subsp. mandapamensis]
MGSDDIFHKLKKKAAQEKKRQIGKREPYPKFLVVCEDTVSGLIYLQKAVIHYKLSTANFSIVGIGEDPLNIVKRAEIEYDKEKKSTRPAFDKVFCVFDRDTHHSYYNALSKITSLNDKIKLDFISDESNSVKEFKPVFVAIQSNPCFELWLLCHFEYTTKLYTKSQNKSASGHVKDDIKKYLPDYDKSSDKVFEQTINLLPSALKHASSLREFCEVNMLEAPYTDMDNLMSFLSTLKS